MNAPQEKRRNLFAVVLNALGSIALGIVVLTILAIAMGWATFLEREMGTPVAQHIVYASNWFYFLIGLLSLNVLCSALVRLPRLAKSGKKQIPFFLAHLGILLLLLGCWTTANKSVKARVTIAESEGTDKAVATDDRLFEFHIAELGADKAAKPERIEVPFSGGPISWRDCERKENWQKDVAEPLLAMKPEGKFFQDLAKGAAKMSVGVAFHAAQIARTVKSKDVLYDKNGLKLEILDYSTYADFAPIQPLKGSLTINGKTQPFELNFAYDMNAMNVDPLATSRRAQRATLEDGARIVYMIADSQRDLNAFLSAIPEPTQNVDLINEEQAAFKKAFVVLNVDGTRYQKSLADLDLLSKYGNLESQQEALAIQKEEIERRLKQEEERTDMVAEERDNAKPLATVSREDLTAQSKEIRELSDKMTDLADSATDPNADSEALLAFNKARQEFERKRLLNYLSTTWSRLESVTATSKEFKETLVKMREQNESSVADVKKLVEATTLGDSGWKIVGFDASPTLAPGVDELQGWSAMIQLETPQGERCEASLFSELFERNKFPENGRVYGALWIEDAPKDDNEYGRPWSKSLDKPKLELMQDLAGRVVYRVNDGSGHIETGTLELSATDESERLYAASAVKIKDEKSAVDGFVINELQFQDEIGARLAPAIFQKDQANEFYGKARVRVTLDDVEETFLMRTIPLESVSQEQIAFLERKIVSSKRQAVVRLIDREIDLGATLFVKRFSAVYEPGSSTAASFSSLIQILPPGLTRDEQRQMAQEDPGKDALIRMNRPGVLRAPGSKKVYWAYQDSFRGPYRPGDPEFDSVVEAKLLPGETKPRAQLYQTILTLNNDPGRGMKYLGSLMIVWGTAMLIYRRKRSDAPKRKRQESNESPENACVNDASELMQTQEDNASRSGKASILLLALIAVAFGTAVAIPKLVADEIIPPEEARKVKHSQVDKLDWTAWRLLPVYDGGRRQPLNTFAEILVRDITGSNAPTIELPEEVLKRLEGDKPLNLPTLAEFLKDLETEANVKEETTSEAAAKKRDEQEKWYNEVAEQMVDRQRDAAKRLRAIFPNGSRKFEAAELLFSWIVEPEIWEYAPFIDDPEGIIAKEALKRNDADVKKRRGRLAPEDFDAVDPSGTSRIEQFRAQTRVNASKTKEFKALEKFEDRVASFRSVSFLPTQTGSERPIFYLNKILYGDHGMNMAMGGIRNVSVGATSKLDASAVAIERLLIREKRALRKESPFNDKEYVLRQRTPKAGESGGDALMLTRQIAMLASMSRRYSLTTTGFLYEKLLVSLSKTYAELQAHQNEIIVEEKFSKEYRQEIQRCVDALGTIVENVELAYLSLTSEPPKTLNVVPVVRASLFRGTENQGAPWLSIQTLLFAPDVEYARFIDPTLFKESADEDPDSQTIPQDAEKITPFDDFAEALQKTIRNGKLFRQASRPFRDAALAYRDRSDPNRAKKFNEAIEQFAQELFATAQKAEPKRVELAEQEIADPEERAIFLAKTCYASPKNLKAEVFYYDLNAFFWNWVACLAAVAAFVLSFVRRLFWRVKGVNDGKNERFFFALGLICLALSCAVAFLGGAVRAYITGWAPVANMFETVVLLAFLIAAIAIGYALAPVWSKPYLAAWRATAFPRRGMTREELSVAFKTFFPRVVLIAFCLLIAFNIWRAGHASEPIVAGLIETFKEAFAMKGALDSFAVFLTFLFVVWSVPRFIVTLGALAIFPKTLWRRDDLTGTTQEKLSTIGMEIASRKTFIAISAVVALAVAAAAYFNSVEFNPHIRPLVAVLRSNFWLTIHVIAIIVSYALGSIAWVVALTSLGSYIFGKYEVNARKINVESNDANKRAQINRKNRKQKNVVKPTSLNQNEVPNVQASELTNNAQTPTKIPNFEPQYATKTAHVIETMIRSAVLFLTAGIILGARWADFSWGRFWSWDPKEVWALVTLLIYLVVLHAHKISGGKRFVLALGANFGALAIIMTWYGLSFIMGGGGRHSYASGESNKIVVLYALFAINIAWSLLAIVRYAIERFVKKQRTS